MGQKVNLLLQLKVKNVLAVGTCVLCSLNIFLLYESSSNPCEAERLTEAQTSEIREVTSVRLHGMMNQMNIVLSAVIIGHLYSLVSFYAVAI